MCGCECHNGRPWLCSCPCPKATRPKKMPAFCRWFGHKWEHPRSITEYRPVCARCGHVYGRDT